MVNSYGNYVVQKALKLSSKSDKITLINNIFKNIEKIKDRKLYLKWKLIIESNLEGTFELFDDRNERKPKSIKTEFNPQNQKMKNSSYNEIREFRPKENLKPNTTKHYFQKEFERNYFKNA